MKINKKKTLLTLVLSMFVSVVLCAEHPCLTITKGEVANMRNSLQVDNLFSKSVHKIKGRVDAAMAEPRDVPVPKDAGGGYTHERHKSNAQLMYEAGLMYQLFDDEVYAKYVKDMLVEYAKMYKTLPLHPVEKSSYRGRLFWQGLNECVWLVNAAQAYDCVYDYLSTRDRKMIEEGLFRPMVNFIVEDNKTTFTKIHNHATWAVAGVGMISYVMGDYDMVERCLNGYDKDGESGFLRQIDDLFSPDGYYAEGPYYQRYSLQPFVTFALVVNNNDPQRKIFEYKNGVLVNAVFTLLQLSDEKRRLFYFNDSLTKDWSTTELVWGVDIAYSVSGDKRLLSVAKLQNRVTVSNAGLKVSQDLKDALPFEQTTLNINDGKDGKSGGVAVLRTRPKNGVTVSMKYTSQGMGHGHFDRLSYVLYDRGEEVVFDYGAARFLNIEQKNGGRYLEENDTFAKQTIAHNTLVVDKKSHYNAKLKQASKYSPDLYYFDNTPDVKMISAVEKHAVKGVELQRAIFLLSESVLGEPVVVDLFHAYSDSLHTYDLPLHYKGQLIETNYAYTAKTKAQKPLGKKYGYQYFWVAAKADSLPSTATTTWLNNGRFYSLSMVTDTNSTIYLCRLGANDPNFNLRPEPSIMLRSTGCADATFVSVLEAHGEYNPRQEFTNGSYARVHDVEVLADTDAYTVVRFGYDNKEVTLCYSKRDNNENATHKYENYEWVGAYKLFY